MKYETETLKKIANISALAGIITLQSWMIPAIIQAFNEGNGPPLASCFLMIAGFIMMTLHSVTFRVHLYTFCNLTGILGNMVLICLLL
jgi:hypothetical protein